MQSDDNILTPKELINFLGKIPDYAVYVFNDGKPKNIKMPETGYGKITITFQGGKISTIKTEIDQRI